MSHHNKQPRHYAQGRHPQYSPYHQQQQQHQQHLPHHARHHQPHQPGHTFTPTMQPMAQQYFQPTHVAPPMHAQMQAGTTPMGVPSSYASPYGSHMIAPQHQQHQQQPHTMPGQPPHQHGQRQPMPLRTGPTMPASTTAATNPTTTTPSAPPSSKPAGSTLLFKLGDKPPTPTTPEVQGDATKSVQQPQKELEEAATPPAATITKPTGPKRLFEITKPKEEEADKNAKPAQEPAKAPEPQAPAPAAVATTTASAAEQPSKKEEEQAPAPKAEAPASSAAPQAAEATQAQQPVSEQAHPADQEQQEQQQEEAVEEEEEEDQTPPSPLPFEGPYTMAFMMSLRGKPQCRESPTNPNKSLSGLLPGCKNPLNQFGRARTDDRPSRQPRTGPNNQSSSLLVGGTRRRGGGRRPMPPPQARGPHLISVHIPDTDVTLKRSENAFKRGEQSIIGNLRGHLGKITLDNFDDIVLDIIQEAEQLPPDSEEFDKFIELIQDTAKDSEFFSMIYAKLCKSLSRARTEKLGAKFPTFQNKLLAICKKDVQEDFKTLDTEIKKLEKIVKELQQGNPNDPELQKQGDELYTLNRKRQKLIGNAVFVAELFNETVVSLDLLKQVVETYWKQNEAEDAVMCMCKIVEKAGAKLEKEQKPLLEEYLGRLSGCKHIPNKLQFFIMDIKDLRKKGWVKPEDGPRKRKDVIAEAQAEMKSHGRPLQGRRTSSSSQPGAKAKMTQERRDVNKIGLQGKLAPMRRANQASRFSRGSRPTLPGSQSATPAPSKPANRYKLLGEAEPTPEPETPAAEPAQDLDKLKRSCRNTIEEYVLNKDDKELYACVRELGEDQYHVFVSELVADLFGLIKAPKREALLQLLQKLMSEKILTHKHALQATHDRLETLDDDSMDSPKAPAFLAQFVVNGLDDNEIETLLKDESTLKPLMNPFSFVVEVVAAMNEAKGEEAAKKLTAALGGDLSSFQKRKNEALFKRTLERKGLSFLLPTEA
ncbi:hypothetical protein PTSG_05316 [Salpingoeca rosetta]|uniref:MI domain-containing protein n=1 Tax=Salpingoeca rosetta (strain ATCC 50818 / BSB-021) TaxID=946362 RepID=F2UA32_SALR5|nr:uncharacterized protein PTSG_05316 [Salpingoeca rosetta]EGD73607.1 hypothetical protein PTSG_05316 [Salpingoeca rosetta]|eukprot:XP_004993888.1 hypothetical protein PTSG_05316 [Salpingoeca rosetta]